MYNHHIRSPNTCWHESMWPWYGGEEPYYANLATAVYLLCLHCICYPQHHVPLAVHVVLLSTYAGANSRCLLWTVKHTNKSLITSLQRFAHHRLHQALHTCIHLQHPSTNGACVIVFMCRCCTGQTHHSKQWPVHCVGRWTKGDWRWSCILPHTEDSKPSDPLSLWADSSW